MDVFDLRRHLLDDYRGTVIDLRQPISRVVVRAAVCRAQLVEGAAGSGAQFLWG